MTIARWAMFIGLVLLSAICTAPLGIPGLSVTNRLMLGATALLLAMLACVSVRTTPRINFVTLIIIVFFDLMVCSAIVALYREFSWFTFSCCTVWLVFILKSIIDIVEASKALQHRARRPFKKVGSHESP